MMKSEKGVTMVTLIVTVIVTFILIGTGLSATYTGITNARNNKMMAELGIVSQAVTERYSMAVAVNKTNVSTGSQTVEFWVGSPIEPSEIWNESGLTNDSSQYQNDAISQECLKAFEDYSQKETIEYQEDYYYLLTQESLSEIGINESDYNYIVNYKTGEVYNATKKMTSKLHLLYTQSTLLNNSNEKTEDTETFNDWE